MSEETASKSNKLCFKCDRFITDNDKININSIKHSGVKFNIKQQLENFKLLPLANIDDYDLNFMHQSCYLKMEKELSKI